MPQAPLNTANGYATRPLSGYFDSLPITSLSYTNSSIFSTAPPFNQAMQGMSPGAFNLSPHLSNPTTTAEQQQQQPLSPLVSPLFLSLSSLRSPPAGSLNWRETIRERGKRAIAEERTRQLSRELQDEDDETEEDRIAGFEPRLGLGRRGTLGCIKYTISDDTTKGEQARNKARLSAIADRPRILGSKRSSVLGFAHGRTGIEAHRNHATLLLKDRSGFFMSSHNDLQKEAQPRRDGVRKKNARFGIPPPAGWAKIKSDLDKIDKLS